MSAYIYFILLVINIHCTIRIGHYCGTLEFYVEQIHDKRLNRYLRNMYLSAIWGVTLFIQTVGAVAMWYCLEKGI